MKKLFTLGISILAGLGAYGQNLINDGGTITIAANDTITVPGYFNALNAAQVTNNGVLEVAGNFTGTGSSLHQGSGIYRFNGTSPQTLDIDNTTLTGIELANDSNLYLNTDISGVAILRFSDGYIYSNGKTLTMAVVPNSVTGADSTRFYVCNNNGAFKYLNVGQDTAFFPIGLDTANYNPAWLVNSGTADNMAMHLINDVLTNGATGTTNTTDQHLVNRTWVIDEDTPGGSIPWLKLQWSAAHQRPLFNPGGNIGISYFIPGPDTWSAIGNVPAAGANPYTVAQWFAPNPQSLTATAFIIADENSPVSVKETAFTNVTVFPNPAAPGNAIQFTAGALANKNVSLMLYNAAGQLVFSEKNTVSAQGMYNTTLPTVSSGLYMLTISDGVSAIYKGKLAVK